MEIEKIVETVRSYRKEMIACMTEMLRIPAISPDAGGEGEYRRAEYIVSVLKDIGIRRIERYDAPDRRAYMKCRPNIVAHLGQAEGHGRLWVVSHMDTVPPGDRALWKHDPFDPLVRNGRIYGRGSEDNGQSLVASIYAAKALLDNDVDAPIMLSFMSDEELGSERGIGYVASRGIFKKGDEFLVPDGGSPAGDEIEIAEKSSLWARVRTSGIQTHASRPDRGINASLASSRYLSFITDFLYSKYREKDALFEPVPRSTFEPTKRMQNVENVNTIPGTDEFYIDCRILPSIPISSVLKDMRSAARLFSGLTGSHIDVDVFRKSVAARPTDMNSNIARITAESVREMKGVAPRFIGVGGGTCANIVRAKGHQAAVWSTICDMAHQPDEYCLVDNMVGDAAVMARICASMSVR